MTLYELLERTAAAATGLQRSDGSMPPGHNGLYRDPETPLRNTAHWLITFLKVYDLTGKKKYKEAAYRAANYITKKEHRPSNATFLCRMNPKKDRCNGLIGQAWIIEALAESTVKLEMPELIHLAEKVFLLHPLDEKYSVWNRVEVDRRTLHIDMTFNHQLWFAAAGALLKDQTGHDTVNSRVLLFLNNIGNHFELHRGGIIRHHLMTPRSVRAKLHRSATMLLKPGRSHLVYKAIGYHSFNLYAFAMLKSVFPEQPLWNSEKFKNLSNYARSEDYKNNLEGNIYGYSYNPPGFEIPYFLKSFSEDSVTERRWWVTQQLNKCFNYEEWLMNRGTPDPVTHAARIYEATRIDDTEI